VWGASPSATCVLNNLHHLQTLTGFNHSRPARKWLKPLTTFESLLAFGPPSGAGRLRLTGFMACHVTSVADGQLLASARSSLSSFLKWGW
jgi:hypothetical protein